jgi:cytochrome b6-f complex subunit 7
MGGEMFTAAVLSFTLILVGIGMGYLLLKIQGNDKEESL